MIAGLLLLALVYGNLVPKEISAVGVTLTQAKRSFLVLLLMGAELSFIAAFWSMQKRTALILVLFFSDLQVGNGLVTHVHVHCEGRRRRDRRDRVRFGRFGLITSRCKGDKTRVVRSDTDERSASRVIHRSGELGTGDFHRPRHAVDDRILAEPGDDRRTMNH